jgi:DNA-binding NtrC family response regulator
MRPNQEKQGKMGNEKSALSAEHPAVSTLIISPEKAAAIDLCEQLRAMGYNADYASSGSDALDLMGRKHFDTAIIDAGFRPLGIDLLKRIKAHDPNISAIILAASVTLDAAADYMGHGAFDVLGKPYRHADLTAALRRADERKALIDQLKRLKRRNWLLAATIPLWILLGYLLVKLY